ncbi:MAG: 50S ribosomal protein L18 [Spirochaetales bacterium]
MIKKINKNDDRKSRQLKVRSKVSGTASRPRLNVYRSTSQIYAQLIDDVKGVTLVSASTMEKEFKQELAGKTKVEQAFMVGERLGAKAKKAKIKTVIFDRAGYLYTGRVKSLAEGARKAGLEF